jgi:hypothetical protein
MSIEERQRQFKEKIVSHGGIRADARIAENFGFSNSARVIEGAAFLPAPTTFRPVRANLQTARCAQCHSACFSAC